MAHNGESLSGRAEYDERRLGIHWRMAAWIAAAFLLLIPLVAMRFTDEVLWTGSDFVFASVLLFVPLGIYELVVRTTGDPAYRAGACIALVAALLLLWSSGAVGITDTHADSFYHLALGVGFAGSLVVRFRAKGMALAMFATAIALASAGVITVIGGMIGPNNSAFEIMGITEFFAALFLGSGLLFREAGRA